jgi:hypothetical protein
VTLIPAEAAFRLAEVERQIAEHQAAIVALRGEGAWLLPDATSGHAALKWLTSRGATDKEARQIVGDIVKERRLQRQNAEVTR